MVVDGPMPDFLYDPTPPVMLDPSPRFCGRCGRAAHVGRCVPYPQLVAGRDGAQWISQPEESILIIADESPTYPRFSKIVAVLSGILGVGMIGGLAWVMTR